MATLRNLALDKLREHGHTSVAAGLREMSYAPVTRSLDLLALCRSGIEALRRLCARCLVSPGSWA